MLFKSAIAGMALAAPLLLAGQVQAASTGIAPDTLARNIGAIVRSAETSHTGSPATRQGEVQTAVEDLIASAAPSPAVAKSALERLLTTCTAQTRLRDGIDCPVEPSSYLALRIVLGVVDGLTKDAAGDVSNQGPSAFDTPTIPINGGGGSDYRTTP